MGSSPESEVTYSAKAIGGAVCARKFWRITLSGSPGNAKINFEQRGRMKMKRSIKRASILCFCFVLLTVAVSAQTTQFTYQGKLTDTGNPATAVYQMQFSLFDAAAGEHRSGRLFRIALSR